MVIVRRTQSLGRLAALFVLAASVGVLGCGKKVGTVSGTVTYLNKPVTSGEVVFLSEDAKTGAHAHVQPDGSYKATDVPIGTMKVGLVNPPLRVPEHDPKVADSPEIKEAVKRAALYVPTPPGYRDPNQSGLTTEVKPGDNTYNLELK
jgi:hypothetical protein